MEKMFTPLQIGGITFPNRAFMAPISLGYESQDGVVNEKQEAYWLARVKGGVGCVIMDATSVDPNTPYLGNTLCFRDESSIERFHSFTDKVHALGGRIIPQLTHPGPESISAFFGVPPVASSSYLNSMAQKTRALTLDEIPHIIELYAQGALNAKKAGFDGIELHAAHAYMLLGSFLSPLRNKRTDCYGGSLDNRARLLFEVLDAIRERCGKDFPIILRMSGTERDPDGNTLDDMLYLVPKLIAHGVDAFEVSGSTQYERPQYIIPGHSASEACNLHEAMAIRQVSTVPVIAVGKFLDPRIAMHHLEQDHIDGVVFGRALIADANLVQKAKDGLFDEIAPCTACMTGCVGEQTKRLPGSCVINPFVGRETELLMKDAEEKKKIAVIGGGIGGMACARLLAIRGHEVTIFERTDRLGGQINLACVAPFKQELSKWIVYLNHEIERLNIKTEYNHEITAEEFAAMQADYQEIVLSTGASPSAPPVEGLEQPIFAQDILSGNVSVLGGNVLIVGGGMVGMEVCEYLHAHAMGPLYMTLIEMQQAVGAGMPVNNLKPAMERIYASGTKVMTNTTLLKVGAQSAVVEQYGRQIDLNGLTHIIFATGSKPNPLLAEAGEHIHVIGDAKGARQALEAVREATELALAL